MFIYEIAPIKVLLVWHFERCEIQARPQGMRRNPPVGSENLKAPLFLYYAYKTMSCLDLGNGG